MDMVKKVSLYLFLYVLTAVVILPFLITLLFVGFSSPAPSPTDDLKEAKGVIGAEEVFSSELEEYIVGVVAAEMPAAFPLEALKAQAVAARTYQVRKMEENNTTKVLYDVGQAYIPSDDQKKKWGTSYPQYSQKIRQAVTETQGEIMVYDGEPILAVFHAQSAGKTETAENVWASPLPYLKSVDSSKDKNAPQNTTEVSFSTAEIKKALASYGTIDTGDVNCVIDEISPAGYVQKLTISGIALTGRQLREALGLRSASFTVKKQGDSLLFTTHGYGHGAGMSQYGASFLAEEGKNYHEILNHYYQDISFEHIA